MLRNPGQARGGRQQGGGPRIESLWPGWRKMPSIGGSRWETLSLMHAAKQQAQIFPFFKCVYKSSKHGRLRAGMASIKKGYAGRKESSGAWRPDQPWLAVSKFGSICLLWATTQIDSGTELTASAQQRARARAHTHTHNTQEHTNTSDTHKNTHLTTRTHLCAHAQDSPTPSRRPEQHAYEQQEQGGPWQQAFTLGETLTDVGSSLAEGVTLMAHNITGWVADLVSAGWGDEDEEDE
eukprot:1160924-Pelagomonas_calceolata.AAC.2